jgi:hypothetical protein
LSKKHTAGWAIRLLKKAGFKRAALFLAKKNTNPAAVNLNHPQAPVSKPLPASHKLVLPKPPAARSAHVVYWAHKSLLYAGKMNYTEDWKLRQEFFGKKKGDFYTAHADCSQYVSTILHWLGAATTSTDYTGSLWNKGRVLVGPQVGAVAIWGAYPGQHTAFVTGRVAGKDDWYVVGFGHQGAPDRNTLSGMNAYFKALGHPGVRFLSFDA